MKTLRQIVEILDDKDRSTPEMNTIHRLMRNHYDVSMYSPKETDHLLRYSSDSKEINGYIWNNHQSKQKGEKISNDPIYEKNIKHLDSAMKQIKTPHTMTVYSGTNHDPREKMNKNGIVHHPAYLSTSLSQQVSHTFAALSRKTKKLSPSNDEENSTDVHRHILHIHVPRGHSGVYMGHSDITNYETERELILPRGTNLKYHGTKTERESHNKNQYNNVVGDYVHVHHMSVLPEGKENE